ncbi:hypothetical protein [Demequina mangrovi]|uniref:DUF4232 domain-containing protein n=1 Tax=Demequina mangrovi TaxID=1043493 RepID=A0A1H6VY59_9MICO|nr:hypothetical protein [Demequina mangrovi]SEJ09543.1 hypothetical protein SAMN05421637_0756 [Demequina mangrovi]
MKGFREPVGEHPAEVYWRRRIVLAVALVVLVLIGKLVWSAVASGVEPESSASSSPEPTVTASAESDAEATPRDDPEAEPETTDEAEAQADEAAIEEVSSEPEPSPEPSETTPVIGACGKDDIAVALGSKASIAAEAVTFDVTVTQTGDEPCLLDAAEGASALLVTSGSTRIWSSADCEATATLAGKEWLLASGKSKTFQVSWPRAWSSEGCGVPSTREPQPGTYWAELTFQGQTPDAIPFVLS